MATGTCANGLLRWVCLGQLACLLQLGCGSVLTDVQLGPTTSARGEAGRVGGMAQVASGMSLGTDESVEGGGVGLDARAHVTKDVQQLALGPHLYALQDSGTTPYARAGMSLLELGSVDRDFSFGMFGPYAQVGWVSMPFVVSAIASYSLRFARDDDVFFGLMLGIGAAGTTGSF